VRNRKFNNFLACTLLFLSIIATVTVMPWTKIFPEPGYSWPYITMPIFLWAGYLGWVSKIRKLCAFGIYGSYLYLFIVVCSIVPNDEAYYMRSMTPPSIIPSTEFLILRLICLSFIGLALIASFRLALRQIDRYVSRPNTNPKP